MCFKLNHAGSSSTLTVSACSTTAPDAFSVQSLPYVAEASEDLQCFLWQPQGGPGARPDPLPGPHARGDHGVRALHRRQAQGRQLCLHTVHQLIMPLLLQHARTAREAGTALVLLLCLIAFLCSSFHHTAYPALWKRTITFSSCWGAGRPQEGQFGLREWEPDGEAPLPGLQVLAQQPGADGAGAPAGAPAAGSPDRAERRARQADDEERAQADAAAELRVLPGRVSSAAGMGLLHCFCRLDVCSKLYDLDPGMLPPQATACKPHGG